LTVGYRTDGVQAAGGIEDERAGGKLDGVQAVGVVDVELAAVVGGGVGKEEGAGEVGADTLSGGGELPYRGVHMRSEGLAAGVAVEHGREDA
jgi:hypothetical protein